MVSFFIYIYTLYRTGWEKPRVGWWVGGSEEQTDAAPVHPPAEPVPGPAGRPEPGPGRQPPRQGPGLHQAIKKSSEDPFDFFPRIPSQLFKEYESGFDLSVISTLTHSKKKYPFLEMIVNYLNWKLKHKLIKKKVYKKYNITLAKITFWSWSYRVIQCWKSRNLSYILIIVAVMLTY